LVYCCCEVVAVVVKDEINGVLCGVGDIKVLVGVCGCLARHVVDRHAKLAGDLVNLHKIMICWSFGL